MSDTTSTIRCRSRLAGDGKASLALVPVLILLLLSACATAPPQQGSISSAQGHSAAADVARSMVGVPYRFGGTSPRGMDCSGLVQYAYREAGIRVPRTVADQRRHSFPVSMDELRAGDLLFFRLGGRISHVGIYLGQQSFVHAPRTGKRVSVTSLDSSYWKKRLVGAGRFY